MVWQGRRGEEGGVEGDKRVTVLYSALVLVSEYLWCVAQVFLARINASVYNEALEKLSWYPPDGGLGGLKALDRR